MKSNETTLHDSIEKALAAQAGKAYWSAIEHYTAVLNETVPDAEQGTVHELRLQALAERGRLLHLLGEQQAALAGFNQYYLEANSCDQAVEALVLIGEQQQYMGFFHKALEAHREGLQLAEALNLTPGRAKALHGIGITLHSLGQPDNALYKLQNAKALFHQLDDQHQEMRVLNAIGLVYHDMGRIDRAIVAYESALDIAREIGERETALLLNNIGECYQDLQWMERALVYHREALNLAESVQLPSVEADIRRNLGVDLCALTRIDQGILYLRQSLRLSKGTNDPDGAMQALYSLALAELRRGFASRAYTYITELSQTAESQLARAYQARALHGLGLYYERREEIAVAVEKWHEALFLAQETGQRLLLWQLHALLANVATDRSLKQVHQQIAVEIIKQISDPIEDVDLRETFLHAPLVQPVFQGLETGD